MDGDDCRCSFDSETGLPVATCDRHAAPSTLRRRRVAALFAQLALALDSTDLKAAARICVELQRATLEDP